MICFMIIVYECYAFRFRKSIVEQGKFVSYNHHCEMSKLYFMSALLNIESEN